MRFNKVLIKLIFSLVLGVSIGTTVFAVECNERSLIFKNSYENEIMSGNDVIFAKRYAELRALGIDEDKARICAKVYYDEISSGKSIEYAKYYSYLLINESIDPKIVKIAAEMYMKKNDRDNSYLMPEGLKRKRIKISN